MIAAFQSACIQCLPGATMAAAGCLLIALGYRFFRPEWSALNRPPRAALPDVLRAVLIWYVLSRALIYAVAYIGLGLDPIRAADLGATWTRWDALHYIGLAENGYVNTGDARFHIVFYPLYPLIVRMVRPILGGDALTAAHCVSNACLIGSGWALFRLVELDQGANAARRAVRLLMLCPVSLFFSLAYSESLFLLLVLLSALAARRGRLGVAILFGALASSTRMLGLLCAVPVFYEFVRRARPGTRSRDIRRGALLTCLIAAGFAAYLALNRAVTGDWFRFLTYQREHWSQQFGSLGHSVRNTLTNLFANSDVSTRDGIWLPQIVAMALVLLLIIATFRRAHPADGAYAILYFYIALSPTWLLSGPRYLGAMYALYPMLTLITRKKWADALITAASALGTAYCAFQYAVAGSLL